MQPALNLTIWRNTFNHRSPDPAAAGGIAGTGERVPRQQRGRGGACHETRRLESDAAERGTRALQVPPTILPEHAASD